MAKDRQLIMKGPLKKKGTSSEHSDLYVFVFDHVLLLTKEKKGRNGEGYKVHKRPIPLELLHLSTTEEPAVRSNRRASALGPHKSYPIVFTHFGRHGGSFTLYATTPAGRKNWVEKIQKQIQALKNKSDSWKLLPVSERFFQASNKVNCSSTYGTSAHLPRLSGYSEQWCRGPMVIEANLPFSCFVIFKMTEGDSSLVLMQAYSSESVKANLSRSSPANEYPKLTCWRMNAFCSCWQRSNCSLTDSKLLILMIPTLSVNAPSWEHLSVSSRLECVRTGRLSALSRTRAMHWIKVPPSRLWSQLNRMAPRRTSTAYVPCFVVATLSCSNCIRYISTHTYCGHCCSFLPILTTDHLETVFLLGLLHPTGDQLVAFLAKHALRRLQQGFRVDRSLQLEHPRPVGPNRHVIGLYAQEG